MKLLTKREQNKFTVMEIALAVGFAAALLWGAGAVRTQNAVAEKVVRLHVLANSDSEADQALKLQVRDKILARATEILEASSDRREAEGLLRGDLLEMERIAAEEIAAAGYHYGVTAQLTNADFPTRDYGDFALPAGNYLALRIVIGEGKGQNWWCVVFPPLCTAAASQIPVSALAAGFTEEEVHFITDDEGGYVLKFKVVEWWEELKNKVK